MTDFEVSDFWKWRVVKFIFAGEYNTYNREFMKKTSFKVFENSIMAAVCVAGFLSLISCSKDDDAMTKNPMEGITDAAKVSMLRSMKDLDGTGRLYEINYTADYKLDQVVNSGYTDLNRLFGYIAGLLYDKMPSKAVEPSFGAGCSAFAAPDAENINFLMGRNYDFRHSTKDSTGYVSTSAILIRTAPKGGKKSISMVDGLNLNFGQGFYNDGDTDLSMMMGLPYAALDGINEDGFAIGILALREEQTNQQTGKTKIAPTVAIRMLLDRASTVKEAVKMLGEYDMDMRGNGTSNYHYFMADATGDYAIVEYTRPAGETTPRVMEVFTGNDTLRCVTNFYVSPTMVGTRDGWGSSHGKARYETLRNTLLAKDYTLKEDDAMALLKAVSQPPTEDITSQTQWSALYNLTEKKLRLSILREFGTEFDFEVE